MCVCVGGGGGGYFYIYIIRALSVRSQRARVSRSELVLETFRDHVYHSRMQQALRGRAYQQLPVRNIKAVLVVRPVHSTLLRQSRV